MICYRDMTFCPFFGDCKKADVCSRPLTADVVISAQRFGVPISQFAEKPQCHEPVEDQKHSDAGE